MSGCTRFVDSVVIGCKEGVTSITRDCIDRIRNERQDCAREEDQGYRECTRRQQRWEQTCTDWAEQCCDWQPCAFLCDLVTWVCVGAVVVMGWVCVAWTWVEHIVCVAWTTVVWFTCLAWEWIVTFTCTVWSFGARFVCFVLDTIFCFFAGVSRFVGGLFEARGTPRVTHVFVLMLENRSFDHMLGESDLQGTDAVSGAQTAVDNLLGNPQQNINPDTHLPVAARSPADFALSAAEGDPGHEFRHVLEQLAGRGVPFPPGGPYPPIDNSGFVSSYAPISTAPSKVMEVFSPEQLPVLNALAREFAVCDQWFSSMPGPTWPNRFFAHAATAGGLDDSPSSWQSGSATLFDGYRFDNGNVFEALESNCREWQVFEGDETPQVFSLAGMNLASVQGRFIDFEDFRDTVSDPLFPSSYSFIEPDYGNILPGTAGDFTCGNSQHPLDDVTRGERLIKDVYEAVRASPHWDSSLLVITWDEHGGFFDHVAPPRTVPPGDGVSDPDNNHNSFDFTQLGVRVPAVIVSPHIPRGTIDHTVYDHASIVKTLGRIFKFARLTERDAQANSFLHLLSLSRARNDAPLTLPEPAESGFACVVEFAGIQLGAAKRGIMQGKGRPERPAPDAAGDAKPVEPRYAGFAHAALQRHLGLVEPAERQRVKQRAAAIKTNADAKAYITEVRQLVRAHKMLYPRGK
jgi:phospholipase C